MLDSNCPEVIGGAAKPCYDWVLTALVQHLTIRSPGLDLLRSVAIALVILWHIPQSYFPFGIKPPGWIGVDLFFVLSGYLIGSQVLRPYARNSQLSFVSFYARRALRILPAYVAVVIVYFTIPGFREQPNIPPLWKFLTFTQNFGLNSLVTGAFSNAWSLCVEEHFYLLLPLIVTWLMMRPSLVKTSLFMWSLFMGGLLLRCWLWFHYVRPLAGLEQKIVLPVYLEKIYYPSFARLDGLLMGILVSALTIFRPEWWRRMRSHRSLLLGPAIIFLSISVWICRDMSSLATALIGFPLLALSFALFLTVSLSWNRIPWRTGAGVGAMLAYSIYLTHKPILHIVHQYGSRFTHNHVLLLLAYPTSILVGAATLHICVERPFLKLRTRILQRPDMAESTARECAILSGVSVPALAGD